MLARKPILPIVLLSFVAMGPLGLPGGLAGAGCCLAQSPREPWTASRVVGTPEPPPTFEIGEAFPHAFHFPTSVTDLQQGNALLVTERDGAIFRLLKSEPTKPQPMVNLQDLPGAGPGVTLWSAALHPKFSQNRYLFVCYVNPTGGRHTRVSRLHVDDNWRVELDSEVELIRWPAGGHNAGCLRFGNKGLLYISTGDGSGPNPPDGRTTGQDITDLLGAILRIDVDHAGKDRQYTIPASNPFVDSPGARGEVWAYGLRNPWKFGIDAKTNSVFVADNGWETWELIHQVSAGTNCGWPVMEGRAALRSEVKVGPTPITPPIKDHPHTEANSVIGGPVYRGAKFKELDGFFVYGDYITGTIWAIKPGNSVHQHETLTDTDLRIVDFCEGQNGELYVLDYDFTGKIYELHRSEEKDLSAEFPKKISQTGLFQSLAPLQPNAGVISYQVQAERWMDGATARRWIAIPGDETVTLKPSGSEFPEGTVLVKQVTMPNAHGGMPLETQLLHFERGTWRPYSYVWDSDGKDAQLVGTIGTQLEINERDALPDGLGSRTWHVNDRTECRLCHNAGSNVIHGFTPHQLNLDVDGQSQLQSLAARQIIQGMSSIKANDPGRLVNPHDTTESLNDRARSYLHANCGMCHHPRGNAIVSFYLRRDMPFDQLRTDKGTGIGTFGMRHAKLIVPHDPYRSVLMYRMSKLGYGRMPYIGSKAIDRRGVALVANWIAAMEPNDAAHDSSPTREGGVESDAIAALATSTADAERLQAALRLAKTTEGALAMAEHFDRHFKPADQPLIRKVAADASSDIRGLLEGFLPESERRATLGAKFDLSLVLDLQGNSGRGKLIYFSDNARCRACHDPRDNSKSLGPTLAEINKKFPRPAEFLQHIVQPSQKVEEKFATYRLVTHDGETMTGMLKSQSPQQIELETADRKLHIVQRADIERLQKSDVSLMPMGLLGDLTPQEAADLLEFIRLIR